MTVIKNQKSNTYEVRTYYKDWTGVRKQKTKRGFKRKCDAQEWERAFKLKENLSLDMYFEDFVDLYLNDIKSRIKYNTWLTKKHIVEKKILPYFSKKKLQEIKPSDIRQWQNTMMNYRNKQGEGYSQVYLKTIHNQLSAILNHAVNFYDLKSNAARKAGSMGKERTKEMLFWTKEEYMKFIEAVADKPISFYAFEILYWCGVRMGELLALTPADFDFQACTIRINKSYQRLEGKGSLNHNSRKFHAKNTDPNRTHWNVEYCNEDIKDVYHELFDDALKRYNDKQTRKDRKIDDYYEKIRSGKQEKLFHEVILQIGDKDNMGSETMEGQLAAKILDEYMKGFQERNPTLRVFAAHLHLDEATPHLHIDFIPYVTGSKRGLDTRVSLKQALSSLGFKGGSRSETELNQWVQSEKQKLAMVMRENEIEWDQKGTHEQHLSVLDYKKKVREQEVEELTEHKNLLEHDLHDISECVDEIQKEKAQAEKERDAVIKKTEVLEKRFSALNSKAGLVDSHAREYGYYPEEWLPEAGTLESAKSYRKRIFPLVKKVANMIQALYSKYLDLKNKNQKLSDRNIDLENRVDRLREEISVIKKENVALLNVAYDMDRVVAVLGENKVKEAIEVAKHLEQVNAKQKGKKRRTDREGR